MVKDCIFCKIVAGELPSFKIYEDYAHLAFLTIAPIKEGHTLVIPKKHTESFFDLEDRDLGALLAASKKVAQILGKALKPSTGKVGVMVAGLEVSHTHVHLIPLDSEKDLDFSLAKQATMDDLEKTLAKINHS